MIVTKPNLNYFGSMNNFSNDIPTNTITTDVSVKYFSAEQFAVRSKMPELLNLDYLFSYLKPTLI